MAQSALKQVFLTVLSTGIFLSSSGAFSGEIQKNTSVNPENVAVQLNETGTVIDTKNNVTDQNSDFEAWKISFADLAKRQGVSADFVDFIVSEMTLLPSVVKSDRHQAEFMMDFWRYTDRALSPVRIQRGKEMLKQHEKVLERIYHTYGVPAHYVLAFWGMETNYGMNKGNVDTLDALSTLSFDKRRRTFFTRELITLLKMMEREKTLEFSGSWAGAFGHFQFMPTTYMSYAVDGNNDGKTDIVNDLDDAFASAANYLNKMRWHKKIRWGREIVFKSSPDWSKIKFDQAMPVKDWEKIGARPADGTRWQMKDQNVMAEIRMPMGVNGPIFLIYDNFKTIMRWNRSELYAFAIGLLADRISGQVDRIYKPRIDQPFSYQQVKKVQQRLQELGYYDDKIDGMPGEKTRRAVRAYQRGNNLPADGFMNQELLNKLMR